jgi:Uma2 family endonuclease
MPTVASIEKNRLHEFFTAEEFLDWLKPGVFADLINGRKVMHSPVSIAHGRLTNFLDRLLASYIDRKKLGELHRAAITIRLNNRNVFMPDLAFFLTGQEQHFQENHIPIAPTWVAEILLPNTKDKDLIEKFTWYELSGVEEYWILDPTTLDHQFFAREDGTFVKFAEHDEIVRSRAIPGFWVKRAWLNPERMPEHPSLTETLAELLGAT